MPLNLGRFVIIALCIIYLVLLMPAGGTIYWAKAYGESGNDYAWAAVKASNGDIIIAGFIYNLDLGVYDIWVFRLDTNGNIKWQKTYDWSRNDEGWAVAVAPNGDIIVAGKTSLGAGGYYDIWVLRLDANGSIKWQKTYGGDDWDMAYAVAVAPNGDIIVAGFTYSFGVSNNDIWVLRLDADGNIKWQKTYGGSSWDTAKAVTVTTNGDIVVVGHTGSYSASYDIWVLRLDANGSIKWQKTYGGSGDDYAWTVEEAANGDIIVAGESTSFGVGGWDAWVLRLDADGNIKWQKTYGGSWHDQAYAVAETSSGDIIVAGYSSSFGTSRDAWVLMLDADGSIKWQKRYGWNSDDRAYAVAETSSGNIIVAGYTNSFGVGNYDAWVIKLPPDGSLENISQDSDAIMMDTDALVRDTHASTSIPWTHVNNTHAVVTDTNAETTIIIEVEKNQPPVVEFVFSPTLPIVGETLTFNASSSYDPDGSTVSYQWDFGDGNTSSGMTVQHTYSQPGTYTVTLTVTDNDGLTSTVSKQIVVLQGESIPDNVNDTQEQIVSKYNSSFDWTTQTPTRTDVVQAVTNAVNQYFSTSDPAVRQEIVDDVTQLVQLYFQLP